MFGHHKYLRRTLNAKACAKWPFFPITQNRQENGFKIFFYPLHNTFYINSYNMHAIYSHTETNKAKRFSVSQ